MTLPQPAEPLLAQVYTLLTGELCDERQPYFVAFRSEFVVSRARVHVQPLSTYQKLRSWVGVRSLSHAVSASGVCGPHRPPCRLEAPT